MDKSNKNIRQKNKLYWGRLFVIFVFPVAFVLVAILKTEFLYPMNLQFPWSITKSGNDATITAGFVPVPTGVPIGLPNEPFLSVVGIPKDLFKYRVCFGQTMKSDDKTLQQSVVSYDYRVVYKNETKHLKSGQSFCVSYEESLGAKLAVYDLKMEGLEVDRKLPISGVNSIYVRHDFLESNTRLILISLFIFVPVWWGVVLAFVGVRKLCIKKTKTLTK